MKHDPIALLLAAVLGAFWLAASAFVHPYPQSVIVAVGGLAGALAIWLVARS